MESLGAVSSLLLIHGRGASELYSMSAGSDKIDYFVIHYTSFFAQQSFLLMEERLTSVVAVGSRANELVAIGLSKEQAVVEAIVVPSDARSTLSRRSEGGRSVQVPLRMKIAAVLLVSLIGFGSHWSSGVTGAMKSTLKKVAFPHTTIADDS